LRLLAAARIALISTSVAGSRVGFLLVSQLPQGSLRYVLARNILHNIGNPNRLRQFLIRHSI
jgi:hypothetical protein